MDNQNPVPETPSSQIYTAPHLDNPPPSSAVKHFSVSRIILPALIVIVIILTISGVYLSQNYNPKPKSVAPKPTPLPTEASAKAGTPVDETASWKTYTNTNYKFTFKYPSNWILTECEDNAVYLGTDIYTQGMCQTGAIPLISFRVEKSSLDALINKDTLSNETADNYLEKTMKVADRQSVRHSGTWKIAGELDLRGTRYITSWLPVKPDETIIIRYTQYINTADYSNEFDKILSTFKFTN